MSVDTKEKFSIAVVLPRYGRNLGGGAETLVKRLVDDVVEDGSIANNIEVWTTCATDHRTWANFHSEGIDEVDGVTVRRFAVDQRDLEGFIRYEHLMAEGKILSPAEQLQWLSESVNSKGLYRHIATHGAEFDFILFAPYLFATSFWGALIHPERSVLLPCLHNEHYAYQDVFRYVFAKIKGLIFNAHAEKELAAQLYKLPELEQKSAVVGMSFYKPPHLDLSKISSARVLKFLESDAPYILYSGRKEQGKNVGLLIDCYRNYKAERPNSKVELCLIGSGDLDFYGALPEGVSDLGFVSEEEKLYLMKQASVLCQPSINESFSIVIMEAWQQQTPVLVHANCAVTREHVVNSGGGLYFANGVEFNAAVDKLLEPEFAAQVGNCGEKYVAETYCPKAVCQRFVNALKQFKALAEDNEKESANARSSENVI